MGTFFEFLSIISSNLFRGVIPGAITIVYKNHGYNAEFLLIKALPSGTITFPSGSISWGENFEKTAKRELFEETGIRTERLTELPVVHKFRYKNLPFKPTSEQHVFIYNLNNVKTKLHSKETEWFRWVNKKDVEQILSHEELIQTFKKALEFIKD